MPKNCTILMVRHGEKPQQGVTLSVAGQARAQAYVAWFAHYILRNTNGAMPATAAALQIQHLFATADSASSQRPRLTITPLAQALGKEIHDQFADDEHHKLAKYILANEKYNGDTLLICWHHGKILELAAELGVQNLPPASNWPQKWPEQVFGWTLQLVFDANGALDPTQTLCFSQQLMYDDYGQNPPG